MSQSRTLTVAADTVVRVHVDGTSGEGCGNSKHLYVGRSGSGSGQRQYVSFIKFNLDWTNVGKIVSATLNLYTDEYDTFGAAGEPGIMAQPGPSDKPKVRLYRLTSAFTVGNNSDGHFDAGDYTSPHLTTSGGGEKVLTPLGADLLHSVDVTGLVKAWAPATVEGGGKATNYGIGLYGTAVSTENWSGWSNDHQGGGGAAERPTITLVYELGPTVPDVPSSMTPSGSVAAIDTFEGNFTDVRPTDTLQSTDIEIYGPSHPVTGTAVDNVITCDVSTFRRNDVIYFMSLTGGAGLTTMTPYYIRNLYFLPHNSFDVSLTPNGTVVNFTTDITAGTFRVLSSAVSHKASEAEVTGDHFVVPRPASFIPTRNVAHVWRARVHDQEGQVSAWSSLVTFTPTNNPPNAPTIKPVSGTHVTNLILQPFSGTYSDPDGNPLQGHQIQFSPFPQGDVRWDEADGILWDSGKVFALLGDTKWSSLYGGPGLLAGTYYWRARVFDSFGAASNWTYAQIILNTDFNPDPTTQDVNAAVMIDPHAPWRILIRELAFNLTGGNVTGTASTDTLTTATAHHLSVGDRVRFTGLVGGAGIVEWADYFVLSASPPTSTTFKISATLNGPPLDFTTNITAGTLRAVTTRGPGLLLAVFDQAKNIGASVVYNSPGELHFTLLKDDPQLSVVEPKQVHYALEFYAGDGWVEKFAGVIWDVDATETDAVIKGIDYLALYDTVIDERYDPLKPNKAYTAGGSFYSNVTISAVVTDQLNRAKNLHNSWVGFISIGSIATMGELVTVYSTMQPTLSFVAGLLDSHRQGTGKRTRMKVIKTTAGTYQLQIVDDPGQVRNELGLHYGELVQGYRVIVFGDGWANVQHVVGRNRDGAKVVYQTIANKAFQPATSVYGRIATVAVMDGVQDQNDLARRGLQAAIQSAKLGKNIALGLRVENLAPLAGWDVTDVFPVLIDDGAINTDAFGSGFWAAYAVAWEATDIGEQSLVITLMPREDTSAPDTDLIPTRPISTQDEWQIAYAPPTIVGRPGIVTPPREYHYDQSTGSTFRRIAGPVLIATITGTI